MKTKEDLINLLKEKEEEVAKWQYVEDTIPEEHQKVEFTCSISTLNKIKNETEISILKQALEVIENERKEILEKLNDLPRLFSQKIGFTLEAYNQLVEDDDCTSVVLEVVEELKQQISDSQRIQNLRHTDKGRNLDNGEVITSVKYGEDKTIDKQGLSNGHSLKDNPVLNSKEKK